MSIDFIGQISREDAAYLRDVLRRLPADAPIVEFGPGATTHVILREGFGARLTSVETVPHWIERVGATCAFLGLDASEVTFQDDAMPIPDDVGLAIIDGAIETRAPSLARAFCNLAVGGTILIHDGHFLLESNIALDAVRDLHRELDSVRFFPGGSNWIELVKAPPRAFSLWYVAEGWPFWMHKDYPLPTKAP